MWDRALWSQAKGSRFMPSDSPHRTSVPRHCARHKEVNGLCLDFSCFISDTVVYNAEEFCVDPCCVGRIFGAGLMRSLSFRHFFRRVFGSWLLPRSTTKRQVVYNILHKRFCRGCVRLHKDRPNGRFETPRRFIVVLHRISYINRTRYCSW